MEVTFTLTPGDVEEMLRNREMALYGLPGYAKSAKAERPVLSRAFFGWVLLISIAVLIFVVFHHDPTTPARTARAARSARGTGAVLWSQLIRDWMFYIFLFGVVGYSIFRRRPNMKKEAAAMWAQNPELQQPQTIRATEEGLTVAKPTAELRARWTHFTRMHETETLFLLLNTSRTMLPVAKRAFASEAEREAFRQLCRARIGQVPGAFPVIPASPPAPNQPA